MVGNEWAKNGTGFARIAVLATSAYSLTLLGLLLPVDDYGPDEQ
jgi:hypothetical protein